MWINLIYLNPTSRIYFKESSTLNRNFRPLKPHGKMKIFLVAFWFTKKYYISNTINSTTKKRQTRYCSRDRRKLGFHSTSYQILFQIALQEKQLNLNFWGLWKRGSFQYLPEFFLDKALRFPCNFPLEARSIACANSADWFVSNTCKPSPRREKKI